MKKGLLFYVISFFLFMCLLTQNSFARDKRDVILVLDTSLSMMGYGGKNIMSRVKESVSRYIDNLEDGDRVTFVTFDTDVRIYPTVLIDDENDRDIVKKYISVTPVKGKWTHTYYMIQSVFKKADELEKDEDDRQVVIVVMTDGIDDPPPYALKSRLDIKEISSRYEDKNWWIFLVNLVDLKKSKEVAKAEQEKSVKLQEELKKVSNKAEVIMPEGPEKAIEDIEKTEKKNAGFVVPFIIAILVIALILALLYYFKKQSELKVRGRLEYWNNDLIKPFIENFNMTRYAAREIVVGSMLGCQLNIREFEIRHPFKIKAVRGPQKDVKMAIQAGGQEYTIEFKNREPGEFLEDGDIFQVNNYSFKYFKD